MHFQVFPLIICLPEELCANNLNCSSCKVILTGLQGHCSYFSYGSLPHIKCLGFVTAAQ